MEKMSENTIINSIEILDADGVEISLEEIEKREHADLLPVVVPKDAQALTVYSPGSTTDPLTQYIREISLYKMLTPEEEKSLTSKLAETGDIEVAKKLVVANLRLVVKIAMEYKSSYQNVLDLVQEGNIGLMKAVSKYDGSKGAKLSYYASWWIKSYILKFILDNFRLVKIGTTNEQKKLFFNLMKEKDRLEHMGIKPDAKLISENLGVSEKSVTIMEHRLSSQGGEFSIDRPSSDDSTSTFADTLDDKSEAIDESLGRDQEINILKSHMGDFLDGLKDRDREIFKKRLLSDAPESLQSIADGYGVSRERIRQIEERLVKNLKKFMSEYF